MMSCLRSDTWLGGTAEEMDAIRQYARDIAFGAVEDPTFAAREHVGAIRADDATGDLSEDALETLETELRLAFEAVF